jgi:serine protease AprX
MKHLILIALLFSFALSFAQKGEYWVFFTDKNDVEFDPYSYFDSKAIERRLKSNIPLKHITDYPINESYKQSILDKTDRLTGETRWFNAIAVWASPEQINEIIQLPFVKHTEFIRSEAQLAEKKYDMSLSNRYEFVLKKQINGMEGAKFKDAEFTGKGLRIAVFDGGFPSVDVNPVFKHLQENNRIIDTWDFVKEKPFVYDYNSHGTACLSCITGITNGQQMGLAIEAEFLLARTEKNTEPLSEEVNWMQAMEWADKNGADIISSSLGYTNDRYFIHDMNGKTSLVTRAANMAAAKGMVVVNSMGNEGDVDWKYMGAPADADSILSIGGIDPITDYHINFSSYGPTADKRLKPNVCGYGLAITAAKSKLTRNFGTSFSAPLIAGFVACAWQAKPELTNMELMREIEKSGHLYPFYDYAHGYGMPQAGYFTDKEENNSNKKLFSFETTEDEIKVILKKSPKVYFAEGTQKVYYHIRMPDGVLIEYALVEAYQKEVLTIPTNKMQEGAILAVFYDGYYAEISL